jgi:glucose-1-phosphate thymidylyltransferase
MSITTGVVLAAGEGTRLRPLTRNRPKPMLPAGNRPILEYVCDALVEAGMERLVLVVGYKRDRVQDHIGHSYRGVPVEYVVQEKQLGSGHALLQARAAVDGPVVVVNGDRVIEGATVEATLEAYTADCAASIAVVANEDAGRYGAVTVRDGRITELVEKPESDDYRLINGGVYAFPESVFEALAATPRTDGELPLTDTVGELIESGEVCGARTDGVWADATYPWDLLTVARGVLRHGMVAGVQRHPGEWVAESARVHEDATLVGPVVIGPDCEVGAGAVVGPHAALGRNATVGANATVQSSVVDADTRVGPASVLVDAVTGQTVRVGAGAVVPGGPADVEVEGRVFDEQRLGAVLGDRVRLGGGARCDPGTLVGPSARIGTGVVASGRVPEGAEVVR